MVDGGGLCWMVVGCVGWWMVVGYVGWWWVVLDGGCDTAFKTPS